jgi:hypothetical protein
MFAGFEGGDRHFGVEMVGRRHRNDLHIRIIDHSPPVARGFFEAELGGAFVGQLLVRFTEMGQPDFRNVTENCSYRIPCHGMAFPHEASSDKTYSDHAQRFLRLDMRNRVCIIQNFTRWNKHFILVTAF